MPDGNVRRMVYEPRPLQREIHSKLKSVNVLVCHRAFGKTVLTINQLIGSALRKPGRYVYVAPLLKQAKNIAWDALRHYAGPFTNNENITELTVTLVNGAKISLYGSDNPDALRGMHIHGVVLDEYAQMPPKVWSEVLYPALQTHGGWAIFIGTPKGQDAFYDIYQQALSTPDWYAAVFKGSESGVFTAEQLGSFKRTLTPEEYEQEFECSFSAANVGSYYGKLMAEAEARITRVPYEPLVPVTTAWDLGIDDSTAIWFVQQVGKEVRLIDYYENSGEGLTHYANIVKSKPYVYDAHLLPHDAQVKELGTGLSRVEVLASLGLQATVVPVQRVEDGINAVRMFIPKCWFDAEKCAKGIKALKQYQREWVDKLGTWRSAPLHDWSSHAADAFRYLATGLKPNASTKQLESLMNFRMPGVV